LIVIMIVISEKVHPASKRNCSTTWWRSQKNRFNLQHQSTSLYSQVIYQLK